MEQPATNDIIEVCRGQDFFLGVFNDRGFSGLIVLLDKEFHFVFNETAMIAFKVENLIRVGNKIVCYDMRQFVAVGAELPDDKILYDMKLLYGYVDSVFELATKELGPIADVLSEQERRLKANVKACKMARVDVNSHPISSLIPSSLLRRVVRLRAMATMALYEKALRTRSDAINTFETSGYSFARALYHVERNGTFIDVPYAEEQLKKSHPPHISKFFRSVLETNTDGIVYTKFNPIGGKTGRIKVDRGFNCLGIAHGEPREAIVSRFEGGLIYSFDFNAIDYRCIVASVDDPEFVKLYDDCDDFHQRTASFFFGDKVDELRRKVIKECTYVVAYGGTESTVSNKTGLSTAKAAEVIEMLNEKLGPVARLRSELYARAMRDGYVETPDGRRIPVASDDHPGKVLGLYAQSYSSHVFERAFVAVEKLMNGMKSKLMFTVHDELVADMHPEEFGKAPLIKQTMESANGGIDLSVSANEGKDYGEASK